MHKDAGELVLEANGAVAAGTIGALIDYLLSRWYYHLYAAIHLPLPHHCVLLFTLHQIIQSTNIMI